MIINIQDSGGVVCSLRGPEQHYINSRDAPVPFDWLLGSRASHHRGIDHLSAETQKCSFLLGFKSLPYLVAVASTMPAPGLRQGCFAFV
jgi:hypothetical protein